MGAEATGTRHDCVVVGAGPAGLAGSAALTARGVEHLLLERGLAGQTWRAQRWDSFRLNTPGWMNPMLDEPDDQAYLSRDTMVRRLQALGAAGPLREQTEVQRLDVVDGGFDLQTSGGPVRSRTVVVASGDQNVPKVPPAAAGLPGRIVQQHTATYRSAGSLPEGAVLVVGSGQSGCQIAADLLDAGRRVYVSTSAVGRVPTPYRGRETLYWMVRSGFYDQTAADVPDLAARLAPTPLLAPGGAPLGLPTLARRGATLVGRLVGVDGERFLVDGSTAANLAAGEAFAARARMLVDAWMERTGVAAPPAEPDLDAEQVPVEVLPELDLRAAGIATVLWCTSFTGNFSWMPAHTLDDRGLPVRTLTAGAAPGLWFVGLRWLTHRASAILYGFPRDAERVADAVVAHLHSSR